MYMYVMNFYWITMYILVRIDLINLVCKDVTSHNNLNWFILQTRKIFHYYLCGE